MIIDSIKNASLYEHTHPLLAKVFQIVRTTDFVYANPQKVIVEENKTLFYMITDTPLARPEEIELEAHQEYIDIQIPVSGKEIFGWKPSSECQQITTPYNKENDIVFFGDKPDSYISVLPGQFLILFPGDAHAPCIGNGTIRKVVFKIRVNTK